MHQLGARTRKAARNGANVGTSPSASAGGGGGNPVQEERRRHSPDKKEVSFLAPSMSPGDKSLFVGRSPEGGMLSHISPLSKAPHFCPLCVMACEKIRLLSDDAATKQSHFSIATHAFSFTFFILPFPPLAQCAQRLLRRSALTSVRGTEEEPSPPTF